MQKMAYLNTEEIQLLKQFNCKNNIASVFYYFWINNSKPNENYSFIDVIEFIFDNQYSLFFKINEDDSDISITVDFEFERYNANLQNEFGGQIRIQKVEATPLEIWNSIGQKGQLLSSTFLISFKNQKIELNFNPIQGLLVSEQEEV
jgi:NAD-specific glutamate dehydrogenase